MLKESPSTHERILDGAMRAVAQHGLAKLAMRDVGACAGVARGTVYRHFPNREALLDELTRREALRFMSRWRDIMSAAAEGPDRIRAAFEFPARFAREYPMLQRLVETDPGYVLATIREQYPVIRVTVEQLLGPLLAENPLARRGVVSAEQLVDLLVRVLVSAFLFPSPDPEKLGGGLAAIHSTLRANGAR